MGTGSLQVTQGQVTLTRATALQLHELQGECAAEVGQLTSKRGGARATNSLRTGSAKEGECLVSPSLDRARMYSRLTPARSTTALGLPGRTTQAPPTSTNWRQLRTTARQAVCRRRAGRPCSSWPMRQAHSNMAAAPAGQHTLEGHGELLEACVENHLSCSSS